MGSGLRSLAAGATGRARQAIRSMAEVPFQSSAYDKFEHLRREMLEQRHPSIACLANFEELSEHAKSWHFDTLFSASHVSTECGCGSAVVLLGCTDRGSDGFAQVDFKIAETSSQLGELVSLQEAISHADPLDLRVASEELAIHNSVYAYRDNEAVFDAAVFFVGGKEVIDERVVSQISLLSRQGTVPFILHRLPPKAAYDNRIQGAFERCAGEASGLYVPYFSDRMDVLADHLGSVVTFAIGLPSVVRDRVDQVRTDEGRSFAMQLAKPFADLNL